MRPPTGGKNAQGPKPPKKKKSGVKKKKQGLKKPWGVKPYKKHPG